MGAAKRRGTFDKRRGQKLAKQFGLTNAEYAEAYQINTIYNMRPIYQSVPYQIMLRLVHEFKINNIL